MTHSTMLNVELSGKNERLPVYEQVATEIRRAIADGEAQPGERLPPARDLTYKLWSRTYARCSLSGENFGLSLIHI